MLYFLGRPVRGLYLSDVCLAQEEHTKSGLSDTAANGVRQFPIQECFMEFQLHSLGASALVQLANERFFIHTHAHRGKLKRDIKDGIVNDNVTVERPVVLVGSSAVVRLAALQLAADLREEDSSVFLCRKVFAFLGCLVGITVFKLLCGDKCNILG